MVKIRASILLNFVLMACSTHQNLKANPTVVNEKRPAIQTAINSDVILYKKAMKEKDCNLFKKISESQFILKDLALLRSNEICDENIHLSPLSTISENSIYFFKALWIDMKIKEAIKTSNKKDQIRFLVLKSENENQFKQKEACLEEALKIATSEKNEEDINSLKTKIEKLSPRKIENPTHSQWINVAQNYREWRDFEKAIEYYKKIINSKETKNEDIILSYKGLRQTYKTQQEKNKFLMVTSEWSQWAYLTFKKNKKDLAWQKNYHEAQMFYARALWTEGEISDAKKILNETIRNLDGRYSLAEAYYTLGKIDEEQGSKESAIEKYNLSLKEKLLTKVINEKTLWSLAWLEFKTENYKEAEKSFEKLSKIFSDVNDQSRALFWLGRTQVKLEKKEESLKTFKMLQQLDPIGFYGLLSYKEAKEKIPIIKNQNTNSLPNELLKIEGLPKELTTTISTLIEVEEFKLAENLLNRTLQENSAKLHSDELLIVLKSYAQAGLYLPLFAAVNNLPFDKKSEILNSHPDLIFPNPFKNLVQEAEKKTQTKAEFLNAIIRQESAFNPKARSPVDAMGLTQLLPSVAKNIAKKHEIPYYEADDLYNPETSIQLGAWELQSLLQRNKFNYILSIASYNASESAIKGWLKSRFRKDPIEFIEEIPYDETRGYIKLVLRNTIFYKKFFNLENFDFPEELLKWDFEHIQQSNVSK